MDIFDVSGEVKIFSCLNDYFIFDMRVLNKLCLLSFSKLCKDVAKLPEVQNVSVVLDVIAWICDGQNEEMQKALREQDTHFDVGMNTEHTPTGVQDTVGYILYVANRIHNYPVYLLYMQQM